VWDFTTDRATFVVNDDPWSENASTTTVLSDVRRFRSVPGGFVEVVTGSRDFLVVDTRSGEVSAPILADVAHATSDLGRRSVVWRGGDPDECETVPVYFRDLDTQADTQIGTGSSCAEAYSLDENLIYLGEKVLLWIPSLRAESLPGEPLSWVSLGDGAVLVRHIDDDGQSLTWVSAETGQQLALIGAEKLTLLHVDLKSQSAEVVATARPTPNQGPLWRVFFDGRPSERLLDEVEITAVRLEDGRYLSISPDGSGDVQNLVRVDPASVMQSSGELVDAPAAGKLSDLGSFQPFPGAHPYLVPDDDRKGVWVVAFDDDAG
jgi:hypothetical protein